MKLGVSIQSDGLRKETDIVEKQKYLAGFQNLDDYLTFLQSNDIQSIELRIYRQDEIWESMQDALEKIVAAGFEVTIHGDLTAPTGKGLLFKDDYPSLKPLLELCQKSQSKFVIPIHAFQSFEESSAILKEKTIHLFTKWIDFIEMEELPIYFALENNRKKEIHDPCNHLSGVTEIVNEVNSPHLGICWDMGHYYSNLLHRTEDDTNRDYNEEVLKPFTEKVIHTHIHGLNEEWVTHFPLTSEKSLPLEKYISLLKQAEYDGVYNLELSFKRWDDLPVREKLVQTIQRLKSAIHTTEVKEPEHGTRNQ